MTKYELKKIFSRMSNKMALVLLVFITGIICYFATNVSYVNKNGDTKTGRKAVLALKTEQKQWSGYLDKEKIQKVIAKNRAIAELRKALPDGGKEKEITYSKGQGIMDIRELLNCSYADEFRSYDYYKADSLTEDDASNFYDNRILLLKNWLKLTAIKIELPSSWDVLSELSIDSSLNIKNMVKLLLFMATEAELLLPLYLSISKTGLSNFISIIIVTLILLISVKSFMMISMLKLVIRLLTSGLEMKISFPLKPERKRERY